MKKAVVLTSRIGTEIPWLRAGATAPADLAVEYVDADRGIPTLDGADVVVNAMGGISRRARPVRSRISTAPAV